MAKQDPIPAYGCMMPNPDLRTVREPSDERNVPHVSGVRRVAARLAAALR